MNEENDIRKELDEIIPGVAWPVHANFSVPDQYFEQLSGNVHHRIRTEDQQEEKLLKALKEKNPFQTPEGYFEQLPKMIWEQVQPSAKTITLPRRRKRYSEWAIAASIAVLVALAGVFTLPNHAGSNRFDLQLASLSDNAIEQYLSTQANNLNTAEIYQYLDQSNQPNTLIRDLTNQDIEEYLDNNVYETNDL